MTKKNKNPHFISATVIGEWCSCGAKATHKVGEEMAFDDPDSGAKISGTGFALPRHNFTAYVCCACFKRIFGRAVFCPDVQPDFNFCRRCQKICGVTDDLRCDACGEFICTVCGCTDTTACIDEQGSHCGWARAGVCTVCDEKTA